MIKLYPIYSLYVETPELKQVVFDTRGTESCVEVYDIYTGLPEETYYMSHAEARKVYKNLRARGARKSLDGKESLLEKIFGFFGFYP